MFTALPPARTLRFLSGSSLSNSPPQSARSAPAMSASAVRIAIVGDVHDDWDLQEDTKALQFLQPDLVLFTGDFGNENVKLVQSVADLEFPKAVILGNHDSWKTQEFSEKKKDGVQLQLECLGKEHVAYRRLDFPTSKLSIVGGRPFSCGGQKIFRKRILSARYGVQDMDGSAKRIHKTALDTPEDHLAILLAHNGPTGLGSESNDICGKDWVIEAGDHGDPGKCSWGTGLVVPFDWHLMKLIRPVMHDGQTRASSGTDLEQAISLLKETTKVSIPLVVFGHMHKELAYGNGLRKMIVVGADKTIYLNGAIVPRVKRFTDEQGTENRSFVNNSTSPSSPEGRGTMRAFTVVEISDGIVDKIVESWVAVVGDTTTLQEEYILFKRGTLDSPAAKI